jgi:preprotein translocase subunit SecG
MVCAIMTTLFKFAAVLIALFIWTCICLAGMLMEALNSHPADSYRK